MLNLSSIKQNWKYMILLLSVFLVAEIIINPIGNFSLNDDWVYAQAVQIFHQNNIIDTHFMSRSTMVMHMVFGNCFTSVFGFSLTALRFSTLFLSFIAIVFVFLLFRNYFLLSSHHSFLLTLLFLFNPLYLSLSNSFMTDVPFISTLVLAIYFYYAHQKNNKLLYFNLSVLFFVWCILIRQLGICFVLGICLVEIFLNKKISFKILFLFFTSFLALFLFEFWHHSKTDSQIGNSYSYMFFRNTNSADITSLTDFGINFTKRWVHYVSFTGFVLFPLLLAHLVSFIRDGKYPVQKKQIILSVILLIPVIWSLQKFPIGNYLYNCGVGPETSYDIYSLKLNTHHAKSDIIFFIIKLLGFLGSFSLLLIGTNYLFQLNSLRTNISHGVKNSLPKNHLLLSIFVSLFFYYLFLAKSDSIFDRYILVFSLFIIPAVIEKSQSIFNKPCLFYVLLSLLILFSVFSSKDYLNVNRTKWEAINFLKTNYNVNDLDIKAGYEHEGPLLLDTTFVQSKYLIGFGNVPIYEKLTSFTYRRYIPFTNDTVFVLKLKGN